MRLFLCGLFLLFFSPVYAERIIPSLSTHRVLINSTFSGTDIILYGLILPDEGQITTLNQTYEVIALVKGENKSVIIREKEKKLGFWLNGDALVLPPTPLAYVVMNNKPLRQILSEDDLKKLEIGTSTLLKSLGKDKFKTAYIRQQEKMRHYRTLNNSITFLTPNWFRARLPIPAHMPIGQYSIEITLVSNGAPVGRVDTNFEIIKTGVEQLISRHAQERTLPYAFTSLGIALFLGLLSFLVFRRS